MKLSIGSIFASVLLTASASAANAAASKPAGAAYFITNEPSGNNVISMDIGTDGKLMSWNAASTQGNGLHGLGAPGAPIGSDGLFSQGSVQTSQKAKALAAVNAGSNTISLFSIDPTQPSSLKLAGQPVSSGGEFPISVAFNEAGNTLCALNGGKVAGVLCYTVQSKLGLIPITNTQRTIHLNQTTPPSGGPANTASQISFSQDGKHLIAAIKGIAPTPGYLAVWDFVEGKGLSENFLRITPGNGGLLPFSLTTIPGKNAFLSADPYLGFDIFDFSGGFKNSSGSSAVAVEGQKAICWSAYSKESGDFYLIDAALSQVIEVNVNNDLKGTMVHKYSLPVNSSIIDSEILSVRGKDFLYILAAGASAVDVLAINGPGKAQSIQSFDIAGPANGAHVTINKNNVQGMATFGY